jgi:hypothetical protein
MPGMNPRPTFLLDDGVRRFAWDKQIIEGMTERKASADL